MDTVCEQTAAPLLPRRALSLANLCLGRRIDADDRELWTAGLDIDRCSQEELLLLACLGYEQGWQIFPPPAVPRLKGLHRYYQVHNSIRLPWLLEKIGTLRAAGIPVLLLKGLAMRFCYASRMPRMMGDYDIAVPEEHFVRAMHLLQTPADRHTGQATVYHGTVRGNGRELEVHCWIFKHHGEAGTDIWRRAQPIDFFGQKVLVLCPQDMLLHLMDNRSRDLFDVTYPRRTPIFLCDCCRVAAAMGTPDMAALAARARELRVEFSARRMLLLLAQAFPEVFPPEDVERAFPDTPAYRHWLNTGLALQRAAARWRTFHYKEGGRLTPRRLVRAAPRHWALYRMTKLEREEMTGTRYSFWRYCLERGRAQTARELVQRYVLRPGQAADRAEG